MAACEETLAGGLWRDGRQHRRAVLREPELGAQADLLDEAAAALPAERTTALLAQALVAIGDVTPIGPEDVRELPIGDRDRLVLALRRLQLGDELQCIFDCACGETLELDLPVTTLLGEPEPMAERRGGTTADGATVWVRAASGADQEHAARLALLDLAAASEELLSACVLEARGPDQEDVAVDGDLAALAESLLSELDPAAELLLAGDCPQCGTRVSALLDPISHVWTELERHRAKLEYEVHVLALHYHWSEREILALSPARRARYLDQLDRRLSVR